MKTKDIFTTEDYFLPFVQIHMVPIQTSVICNAVHSTPIIEFRIFAPNLDKKNLALGVSYFIFHSPVPGSKWHIISMRIGRPIEMKQPWNMAILLWMHSA
jgi:hypothetical protein